MKWWERLNFKQQMGIMGSVIALLIVLLGVIFKKGVDELIVYRKEYRSICIECHTECEKNAEYSQKCLNCHKQNVCEKGNTFKRNKTKGD